VIFANHNCQYSVLNKGWFFLNVCMKSIWNGAIGFGLVNIPVKLYAATESSSLDLDMG
jgi:hypothetical protein